MENMVFLNSASRSPSRSRVGARLGAESDSDSEPDSESDSESDSPTRVAPTRLPTRGSSSANSTGDSTAESAKTRLEFRPTHRARFCPVGRVTLGAGVTSSCDPSYWRWIVMRSCGVSQLFARF